MTAEILDFLIIGAGPAGLSAAVEIKHAGLDRVLVLEKGPSHSQMIRSFYKEGKRVDARYAGQDALCFGLLCLKDGNRESFLSFMDHVISENKIPIRYNTEVWSLKKNFSGLFEVKTSQSEAFLARTVIVAIGKMGKPRQPDYWREIPNDLKNNKSIVFDINSRSFEGKKVLVVGGGDSACEYAQMLCEKSQVSLSYRGTAFSRANDINREHTMRLIADNKIRALMPSNIIGIENDSGRPRVRFSESSNDAEVFDVLLYGLGGMTPLEFLRSSGVNLDEQGEPVVSESKESSVAGLYVVGDILGKGKGGGSIISGFNSASAAVRAMLDRDYGVKAPAEKVFLDHLQF